MPDDINIILRQIKKAPLTIEELDQNFLNLKSAIITKSDTLLLGDDVKLPFGDLPAIEMYSDGSKMIIESKRTDLQDNDVVFEVKNDSDTLFQITNDGRMIGTLDPSNIELDWNTLLTGPSAISLVVDEGDAYTLLTDYENTAGLDASNRGEGTIAYAGGDIYLNVGD